MGQLRFNVQTQIDTPAKGDAVRVLDAVTLAGNTHVTSAAAGFKASDVNKVVWAIDPQTGTITLPPTTIATRVSATEITVTAAATGNGTAQCLVFGTDDTAAFQVAYAAALAAFRGNVAPKIEVPASGYIVSGRVYNNLADAMSAFGPAFVGDGRSNTRLYIHPNITIPGDATPVVFSNVGQGLNLKGMSVDGCFASFALNVDQTMVGIAEASAFSVEDFEVLNCNSPTARTSMMRLLGCSEFRMASVRIQAEQGALPGTVMAGLILDTVGGGTFLDVFASNCGGTNLLVQNSRGRTPASQPINWIGGGWDEGSSPTCALVAAEVNFYGAVGFGGNNPEGVALDVDLNSTAYLWGCNLGRFQAETGAAINRPLNNRGRVIAGATTFRGNAQSVAPSTPVRFVQNTGEFIDIGANEFRRYTDDTTFTNVRPVDCFGDGTIQGGVEQPGNMPKTNGSWSSLNQAPRPS